MGRGSAQLALSPRASCPARSVNRGGSGVVKGLPGSSQRALPGCSELLGRRTLIFNLNSVPSPLSDFEHVTLQLPVSHL